MKNVKIKWKVSDVPSGQYRSFECRSWPYAYDTTGNLIAQIRCEDEYVPGNVRSGDHRPLSIIVYKYNNFTEDELGKHGKSPGRIRYVLKMQGDTLAEAKAIVQDFFNAHRDWLEHQDSQAS